MQWLRTSWKWIAALVALAVFYALTLVFQPVARDTFILPDQPRALVYQALGLMAVIGIIGGIILSRRGIARSNLLWAGWGWIIIGTIGGGIVIGLLNGALDGSPEQRFATTVIRIDITGSRNTVYLVFVSDWRDSGEEIRLSRGRDFFHAAQPGDRVTVTTRAGALGHEWIVDATLAE